MAVDATRALAGAAEFICAAGLPDTDIGKRLQRFISALAGFDYIVIFAYRGGSRPLDLFNTFNPAEHKIFVSLYQEGAFRLDPFYHKAMAGLEGLFRMKELAPDRFFSSEYYRSYYEQTGLAEELGFFVPLPTGVTIVLSLMRRETSGSYSSRDVSALAKAEPLIAAFIRMQWSGVEKRFPGPAPRRAKEESAGDLRPRNIWKHLALTEREASVIEYVLQGHSSESIGLKLKITTGTVKVHRRNVYRKLGISSQTQLLSIYLKGMLGKTENA